MKKVITIIGCRLFQGEAYAAGRYSRRSEKQPVRQSVRGHRTVLCASEIRNDGPDRFFRTFLYDIFRVLPRRCRLRTDSP